MNMELGYTDDFLLQGGIPGDLDSDLEEVDQYCMRQPGLPLPIDCHEQRDCDTNSAMIEFSDSDNFCDFPSANHLQTRYRYVNLNPAPRSFSHYIVHDHATSQADTISQDNSKQLGHGSKATSCSPSISVLYQDSSSGTSQETEALSPEPQFANWQYMCEDSLLTPHRMTECTTQLPPHDLLDDPDVFSLSDPDPCFDAVEIDYEDYYDFEELDEVHHDPGHNLDASLHPPTLLVTCSHPSRDYELNVEEEDCESGEPRSIVNVDYFSDGVRAQQDRDEWEEDDMLVIDF
jgi:hypothetical protein